MFGGITIEEMKNGSSSIRNKVLADVFAKMEIVEHWGSGIIKVLSLYKEKGLPEPHIEERMESLIVTLWRQTTQKTTQKLTETEQQILDHLRENHEATRKQIASVLETISEDGVKYNLANLQAKGLLKREGGRKAGRWIVIEDKKQ